MEKKSNRYTVTVTDRVSAYFQHLKREMVKAGHHPSSQPPYGQICSRAVMESDEFQEWEKKGKKE